MHTIPPPSDFAFFGNLLAQHFEWTVLLVRNWLRPLKSEIWPCSELDKLPVTFLQTLVLSKYVALSELLQWVYDYFYVLKQFLTPYLAVSGITVQPHT